MNKNKIKINNQVIAVLIGVLMSLSTIFYVSAATDQDYFPKSSENTVTVKISGPSGSSSMDILFQTPNHSYKKGEVDRAWFRNGTGTGKKKRGYQVTISKSSGGGGDYNLQLATQKVYATLDNGVLDNKGNTIPGSIGYTIVSFTATFTKPEHEVFSKDTVTGDGHGRFKRSFDASKHAKTDVTIYFEINVSNTGLILDNSGVRRKDVVYSIQMVKHNYTYTLNDSLNGNKSESCTCGTEKYLPNNSYSGYDFLGWKGTNDVTYSAGTKTVLCDNRTFTAQWKAQSHYVTFDTQGGTFPSSLKSQTELDGCKIIPNGIYSIKSNCGSNMYMHVYGASYNKTPDNATAICIYGGKDGSQTQWVIERYKNTQYYTITSYHNGLALSLAGSPTNNSPGTGQRGKQLELWSMEKDIIDYQWYFKENNGHLEIYNRSTNQCLDVYAAGTTDATPIQQYNPNHSYAQWWDFEPVVQTDYPFKLQYANYNLLTPSISPQRGSDKFLGWSTDKNATSPTYTANSVCNIYGNSNVTLYAIYQARATVSYDANGGSNASLPKPKVVDVGSKITLASAGSMGRDNYVFLGWSTDPHATKNYNAADSEVTVNSSGNVVYYAIWKNATGNADLSNVITGDGMFTNDTELEGQNGTTYNSIHDGLDYAKPDGGIDDPGYYIEK